MCNKHTHVFTITDCCLIDVDCFAVFIVDCLHDLYKRSGQILVYTKLPPPPPPRHERSHTHTHTHTQLDLVVQFALSKAGHVPACSPLVNCAVLMSIAFLPLFPITLIRNLTPMQFTSTFR